MVPTDDAAQSISGIEPLKAAWRHRRQTGDYIKHADKLGHFKNIPNEAIPDKTQKGKGGGLLLISFCCLKSVYCRVGIVCQMSI